MSTLPEMAEQYPEVRRLLEDRNLSHTEVLPRINAEAGFTGPTSYTAIRRYRNAIEWIPADDPQPEPTQGEGVIKGNAEVTSTGVTFQGVELENFNCQTAKDWSPIFEIFQLDPNEFMIVDDTVKIGTWQQSKALEDGTRDKVQLFSHSARFKRKATSAITDEQRAVWRTDLIQRQNAPAPKYLRYGGGQPKDGTYLTLIADPQLGKKRTEEAVANWRRGVLGHKNAIQDLQAKGQGPEAAHIAFQGDETEGVCNNYCVGADELILTSDFRWVPARSLTAGDGLYTLEEETPSRSGRRYSPGTVLANEVKNLPSIQIRFSDGTSLLCTAEHPVLARPVRKHGAAVWRWVCADALSAKQYEVCKLADPWTKEESWDAGWMAGIFDGEGHFAGGKKRSANHTLGVSQKRGPVLDRARRILMTRGFDFSESLPGAPDVVSLNIRGGYSEVLRALGTFGPQRLIDKAGYPFLSTRANVTVVGVEDAGVQPIAVMGTSSHTYFANGIASHNTNQPNTVELNLTGQLELDYDLRMWTLREFSALGLPLSASSVISNHGEWTRNGSKDVVTTRGDNSSTHIARQVMKAFKEIEPFGGPKIDWTIGGGDPGVVVNLSGIDCYFSHGYIEKGKGPSIEVKTKVAIERQIIGRTVTLGAVPLWFMAHYHHFYAQEFEGRTMFSCPALEAERSSEYMLDQYGVWSPDGMLGLLVGRDKKRHWSDLSIF